MCQKQAFLHNLGVWRPSAPKSLQISIWVSESEASNFANQNPTPTFPLYVTWSESLIDTWEISFPPLIPRSTGDLGFWNVPAALSCLGFSVAGLVCGPV